MFSSHIWLKYPYFLPYAVMVAITVMGLVLTTAFLNEVSKFYRRRAVIFISHQQTVKGGYFAPGTTPRDDNVSEPLLGSSRPSTSEIPTTDNEEPVPLKHLLNLKILIPVTSYVFLASLQAASNAIQPLFLGMSVDIGGLGLTSRNIGYILGTYGFANGIFQVIMLGRLIRRFGVKAIFVTSISAFIPIYALSPIMNILVRRNGFSSFVWVVLGFQLLASLVMELGYGASSFSTKLITSLSPAKFGSGCIYIYITAASPNKRSLGATNGLALTLVSIGRMLTPAMANSLLSFSIQYQILWGYAAYIVLIFLTIGGIGLASRLPRTLVTVEESHAS